MQGGFNLLCHYPSQHPKGFLPWPAALCTVHGVVLPSLPASHPEALTDPIPALFFDPAAQLSVWRSLVSPLYCPHGCLTEDLGWTRSGLQHLGSPPTILTVCFFIWIIDVYSYLLLYLKGSPQILMNVTFHTQFLCGGLASFHAFVFFSFAQYLFVFSRTRYLPLASAYRH